METSKHLESTVRDICERYLNDNHRVIDILWDVQTDFGWISSEAMQSIASLTNSHRVEVEGVASFYAFFHTEPQGQYIIYLCEDIIDRHQGMLEVLDELEQCLKINVGETTPDGLFSLHLTPCIGLSDQAPAALINDQLVTELSPKNIHKLINALKKAAKEQNATGSAPLNGIALSQLCSSATGRKAGDGQNSHALIQSMVRNNIKQTGSILLAPPNQNAGLNKALSLEPSKVIETLLKADLKGRGGAGFPIARKWQTAADTPAEKRYVICNADEGEPGTFKDRVLLTERAHQLIEGMTIAAFAIGSDSGILYLRAEYRYLRPYLESVLEDRRKEGLLGNGILIDETSDTEFNFNIRIQLGAGAYICGEESSLISSCEGKRGEPKNKPPFPAQVGYLDCPTVVNNVETFCNIPRILDQGHEWFRSFGTEKSSGTKLISVSGDCEHPGIYEIEHGTTLNKVLELAGAINPEAAQVGGASGELVGRLDFDRQLCFEDLPTAGAIMIFSGSRNILEIVDYFMHFFIEESCGYCTPCRVGNVFLKKGLEKIMAGQAEEKDLDNLKQLGQTIIQTSRCGLGHTSPNPILSSIKHFPLVYSALLKEHKDGRQAGFDIQHALDESRIIAKRRSIIYDPAYGSSTYKTAEGSSYKTAEGSPTTQKSGKPSNLIYSEKGHD